MDELDYRTPRKKPLLSHLADKTTAMTFGIVYVIMSSPIWGLYLVGWIFHKPKLITIATAIFAFWANPFAPFIAVCLLIAVPISAAIKRRRHR